MDARINVLWASAPSTILPDTTYYAEDHPQREELLTLLKESSSNLLKKYDFSDEEIEDLLRKRLELDRRGSGVSNEESSEYAKLYHPYAYEDFKKFAPALPLMTSSKRFLGKVPDKVIVDEERFWKAADQFIVKKLGLLLKATLILSVVKNLNQLFNRRNPCLVRCL